MLLIPAILAGLAYVYRVPIGLTYALSGNATDLTLLALWPADEVPTDPFDKDYVFTSPEMAMWLLRNFDFPYDNCSILLALVSLPGEAAPCQPSLIGFAGSSLGSSADVDEKAYALMRHFIERGEPINATNHGLTALHDSILYGLPGYTKFLLENGADPLAPVERPDSPSHGQTACEFAQKLATRDSAQEEVWRVLQSHPSCQAG